MRRPPGLWILLSAGVVWLSLQDVYGIRATSLIFGKSAKTSTTTTEEADAVEEETVTTELSVDPNSTKPTLTGNPQLDYIWDPNLPKELNGYNLSDYPFYERVPEDIDFKCDGLHDGFYASVAHKCQVYHHCLFGTRYDFLCANYTAFDQKTFICHFASEVDCANSKKFWHRNDALYKATTTSTIKPFVIYTPPPQPSPVTISPIAPGPSGPGARRPVGGRRRPFRRRRPQYDYYEDEYYDDYYEERPRANRGRKRPRPRPRPVYEDEYDEEYEEDRYERRGGNRNEERRQYDRRPTGRRRNKDRVKPDYDEEPEDRFEDEDFKLNNRRKPNYRNESEEERYPESRKPGKRRPYNDRTEDYDKVPSRKNPRRPVKDDYEDDALQTEDSRSYERPRKTAERRNKPKEDTRAIIKPVSGTIYDRPRVAPRIKLPVPKSEADKYAYKPVEAQGASNAQEEEEYYDDYEEEPLPRRKVNFRQQDTRTKNSDSRKQAAASRPRPRRPDNFERPRSQERPKRPVSEDYYDEYEEVEEKTVPKRPVNKRAKVTTTTTTSTTTTTTTTEAPLQRSEQPVVRIVKRPFLPSRGGNPYSARGLQPVGAKALAVTREKSLGEDDIEKGAKDETLNQENAFIPSPVVIKVPSRTKLVAIDSDNFRGRQNHQPLDISASKTTQSKPQPPSERNPLDINEEDYDVTLNDALNPTLPNLPIRASPVAFSPSNEYTYTNFQRPRYVVDPQASADYSYQAKPLRQSYVQANVREPLVKTNSDYSGQYSTIRENYRPRQQTEVYHHCLFGTRYDFLCANYTAFDQTLFNCNFVSNVDCENSKKFWHRNDELYITKSTTTTAAPVAYNFYTPPPQAQPLTASPGQLIPLAAPLEPAHPRRPQGARGRPYPRARPQYDYYDEYEELPRPKSRKRRPRPRPVYYDDYEEYEDVRVARRGNGRRRVYNRRERPMRRNKERRKYEYDDADYVYEDDVVLGKKQKDKRRKPLDDYEYVDDRRDRRPQSRREDKPPRKPLKRPLIDDYEYEDDDVSSRRKIKDDIGRQSSEERSSKKVPRLGKRRPPSEDYEDDLQQADNPIPRVYERVRKLTKDAYKKPVVEDNRPIIKPVSGTIYDRPRLAPRINLPVPKNAAEKFAYKPIATTVEEEYDDYEEEVPQQAKNGKKSVSASSIRSSKEETSSESTSPKPKLDVSTTKAPNSEEKATSEEYEDDYEEAPSKSVENDEPPSSTTTTTTESNVEQPMPVIRKFKRPFLPSRGGNPYSSRNLQPVGVKAENKNETQEQEPTSEEGDSSNSDEEIQEVEPDLKPIPNRVKSPLIPKLSNSPDDSTFQKNFPKDEPAPEIKPNLVRIKVPIRVKPYASQEDLNPQNYKLSDTTTTQQSKLTEADVLNGNYDVTINEAISPIIPKLPIRSFSGFSTANDYSYKRFQRPTKYVILDPVVSAGSTYYVK